MGFFEKLKEGLKKTKETTAANINAVFATFRTVDEDLLSDLEDALILADIGAYVAADAIEELRKIHGVGPKVASCALLFGHSKLDAFPVDVWVKRIIEKYFPAPFDASALGSYAGLAQQYLFYYERYLGGQK